MDKKEFDEIKARNKLALEGDHSHIEQIIGIHESTYKNLCASQDDVVPLLAEVERLAAEIATLKRALELACKKNLLFFCPSGSVKDCDLYDDYGDSCCYTCRMNYFVQQAQEQEERK